jgi:very-short-patch-repair endonuclease
MPTPDVLREIRRAARHHGVTTSRQLDLTPRQRDAACASGALRRMFRGVFIDPAHPSSHEQDLAAAVAAGGSRAAAWGRSAGCLWGIWNGHPPKPEIVVPYGRHRFVPDVIVHRSRALDASMVTFRDHIRTTKPLITVLDLGVVVSVVEVGDAIIRGRQKKLFSVRDVEQTIDLYARPGRTGIAAARKAVAMIMIGDRPAESVLEFRFHLAAGRFNLPPYSYQHPVKIGKKRYYIDFAYPEVMLAIEVDGYEQRASSASLEYDLDRQNQLSLAGWNFMRFTWSKVQHDPGGVARDVLLRLVQLGYDFGLHAAS